MIKHALSARLEAKPGQEDADAQLPQQGLDVLGLKNAAAAAA